MVFRAAEILMERKEEYARDMTREMGKVIKETRGDVQEAIDAAYYNAGEGRRLFGPTVPSELPNKFAMAVRQPIGVCGMITPWNFPMAISSWKLLPAVVCGNACVIKPAQDTPLSTFNLVQALPTPASPKASSTSSADSARKSALRSPNIPTVRAISLTGSSAVGRIVGATAAKSFKHCSLELGGKNPMIVLDDANLDLAIEGGLWGAFGTTGQRCTATSRIIVQKGVYREFIEQLRSAREEDQSRQRPRRDRRDGSGSQRESAQDRPELHRDRQERRREDWSPAAIGSTKASTSMDGSSSPPYSSTSIPRCASRRKKSLARWFRSSPATTLKSAIEIANNIEYGLSSSLYTKDVNKAFAAVRDLEAGITYINAPTIGAEVHLPFGGTKATGNGHREGGIGAIDFYTEWKAVYVDYSDKLQKAQIDRVD